MKYEWPVWEGKNNLEAYLRTFIWDVKDKNKKTFRILEKEHANQKEHSWQNPWGRNYLNVIQKQKEGSRNRGKANVDKRRVIER